MIRRLLVLACAAVFLSGCTLPGGASSGCARELPTLEPPRGTPGGTFVVSGGGFGGGCDDSSLPFRPDPPQQDVRIIMRQEGGTWHLATVDADPEYRVRETLEVPQDARSGRALVVIPDPYAAKPMKVPFEVLGDGSG